MKAHKNIPIFPLKSIILPGGQFPLRIFERRYLDMTRDCLKNNNGFIIALTKKDSDYIKKASFEKVNIPSSIPEKKSDGYIYIKDKTACR